MPKLTNPFSRKKRKTKSLSGEETGDALDVSASASEMGTTADSSSSSANGTADLISVGGIVFGIVNGELPVTAV